MIIQQHFYFEFYFDDVWSHCLGRIFFGNLNLLFWQTFQILKMVDFGGKMFLYQKHSCCKLEWSE